MNGAGMAVISPVKNSKKQSTTTELPSKPDPNWPNAYADYAYYLGVTQFRVTEAFEQLELAKRYGPYVAETLLRQFSRRLFTLGNPEPNAKSKHS